VSGTGDPLNNNFCARITTNLTITVQDIYNFRTFSDDGVRLRVGGVDVIVDNNYHPEVAFTGSILLTPGTYAIDLVFFEDGGEASLEFTMSQGNGPFGHVGGEGNPGTTVPGTPNGVPEGGASWALLGCALTGLAGLRRRLRK
jgi:hypothetical protein